MTIDTERLALEANHRNCWHMDRRPAVKTFLNLVRIYMKAGNGLIGSVRIAIKTTKRTLK